MTDHEETLFGQFLMQQQVLGACRECGEAAGMHLCNDKFDGRMTTIRMSGLRVSAWADGGAAAHWA
jgi:hypothetical protein